MPWETEQETGKEENLQRPDILCKTEKFSVTSDTYKMYCLNSYICLSNSRQAHFVKLLLADEFLRHTIWVLASFKDSPGEKSEESSHTLRGIFNQSLQPHQSRGWNAKLTPMKAKQVLQSLIKNMKKHLLFEGKMLRDPRLLDTNTWHSAWWVTSEMTMGSSVCVDQAVNGIIVYLEHPNKEPKNIKPLIWSMQTIPSLWWWSASMGTLSFLSQGNMSQLDWQTITLPHRQKENVHQRRLSANTFGQLCRLQGT